jgi:hypothetical protein
MAIPFPYVVLDSDESNKRIGKPQENVVLFACYIDLFVIQKQLNPMVKRSVLTLPASTH